jgi:hypothetical protein
LRADDAPAAPEHPVSQTGDLWLLGKHRLLCGDSTVASANTSPPSTRARARARGGSENQRPWPADKVERWSIDRLIPYAKNARTHSDAQIASVNLSDKLTVEQWPIDRLIEYAPNPRKNDGVVDQMVGAIREFGFRIPIVAESDGSVVDGHLRLKAARKQQAEFEFAEPGEREVEAERVQVAEFER